MTPEQRDAFLQAQTPVLMVPRFSDLAPLDKTGHRFLAAADGLWIELRRPWLYVRAPIAPSSVAMPYGKLAPSIAYEFDVDALENVLRRFTADARASLPNECAAWGVWSELAHGIEYRLLDERIATPASVEYDRPPLADGMHLAIDLHSHGRLPAYFSTTDDADDAGEVKISVVIGSLHEQRDIAIRLCVLGHFIEADE